MSSVSISYKYEMNRQFLVIPIENEEALKAMWEHLKSTLIPNLEFYVEHVALGNLYVNVVETYQVLNVTSSTRYPMLMPFFLPKKLKISLFHSPLILLLNPLKSNFQMTLGLT